MFQCVGVAAGGVILGEGLLYAGKYLVPKCLTWLSDRWRPDHGYNGSNGGGDAGGPPGAVQVLVHPDSSDQDDQDDQPPGQSRQARGVRFAETSQRHSLQGGQDADSGVNMTTWHSFTGHRAMTVSDPDHTTFASPASSSTPRSSKSTKSDTGTRSRRLLRSKGRGVTSGYGHGEDTGHRKYPVTPGPRMSEAARAESPPPHYSSLWVTAPEASDEDVTKTGDDDPYTSE